ncbi:MAG TPA: hypothetical protein VH867_05030, partial [Burkholderiales bacterium]
ARSKAYFLKKGDRRMQALTCLKQSTVLSNLGDTSAASSAAFEGLDLAPADAVSIRMRLEGNLSITHTWMEGTLSDVVKSCQRIAVEARSRGWEHFAAIAFHNLGTALRHMGRTGEAIRNLQFAAAFWADSPVNPFADNSELTLALLAAGKAAEASSIADRAVVRTSPWPRPNAEAIYGKASVALYLGRFHEASEIAGRAMQDSTRLGPTGDLLRALLAESQWLEGQRQDLPIQSRALDQRQLAVLAPAHALTAHAGGDCSGECLRHAEILKRWDERGARHTATVGLVKIGSIALEHKGNRALRLAVDALRRTKEDGTFRDVRWWLRLYAKHLLRLSRVQDASELIAATAPADPEGWRDSTIQALPHIDVARRAPLLDALVRTGNSETLAHLRRMDGDDIGEARRVLAHRHAPRLYVRSFGSLSLHKGSWAAPALKIERKRMRTLLGLLVAYANSTLTRDIVLDAMWPESDPGSAINSLNQTVFQLRRAIDPDYRDGDSPMYIISNVDQVQLNPDFVITDLQEYRRFARNVRSNGAHASPAAEATIDLIRGEFLAELRYDDWAQRLQTAIHSEVRATLITIAEGGSTVPADTAVRAACALTELDPYDEAAQIAMARQLDLSGKRVAGRRSLERFIERLERDLDEKASPTLIAALRALGAPSGSNDV